MPSSRESSKPTDWNCISYISCIRRWVLYHQCHQGSKYSRKKPHYGNNHFFLHQHQNLRAQARVPWMKPQHCTNTTTRRQVCLCVCVCVCVCVFSPSVLSGLSWSGLFSREEYRSVVPFHAPGDLPNAGIEPVSLSYSALAGGHFSATRETQGGKRTPKFCPLGISLASFKTCSEIQHCSNSRCLIAPCLHWIRITTGRWQPGNLISNKLLPHSYIHFYLKIIFKLSTVAKMDYSLNHLWPVPSSHSRPFMTFL